MELFPQDGVLPERNIQFAKEDEDSFNAGGGHLFKALAVGEVEVDVVVEVDAVGVGAGSPEGSNTPGFRASFAATVNCGLFCP